MITLKRFAFNPFQVNSYVLHDETHECIIIDPGMENDTEEKQLTDYIEKNNLKPVLLVNTHTHIDHVLGNNFVAEKYKLKLAAHKDAEHMLQLAPEFGRNYGITLGRLKQIDLYLDETMELKFGHSVLKIFHTPGHADGSLCFYSEKDHFVITGDVLFYQSIGRTDFPTGDYNLLQKSIWEKLFTLPDETIAYSGHGPQTSIGYEKINNPFVAIGR